METVSPFHQAVINNDCRMMSRIISSLSIYGCDYNPQILECYNRKLKVPEHILQRVGLPTRPQCRWPCTPLELAKQLKHAVVIKSIQTAVKVFSEKQSKYHEKMHADRLL